uniref:Uncharacterized protein LOC114325970 isoform X2 n=1 Tax=Diabrotica virgifera virgifera TaxID=50390 RepID=A0A6P7F3H8_DIAVI
MNILNDVICSLIETPFSRRQNQERLVIISMGRPLQNLTILSTDKTKDNRPFSRSFKTIWYENHKWLSGSYFKNSLFCWPCLLLSNLKQNVWVSQGYSDLKNLSASVKKHESSKEHLNNCLGLKRLEKNKQTIDSALAGQISLSNKIYNEEVEKD